MNTSQYDKQELGGTMQMSVNNGSVLGRKRTAMVLPFEINELDTV
jgi:hypothetical protein